MIEKEEMRVGMLVWWAAERYTKEWSCPCVITHVGSKCFRVMSLDDFKETGDLRMDDAVDKSSRHEMRPSALDEVRRYLKEQEREREDEVTELTRELGDAKESLETYGRQVKEFIAKQEEQKN